MRERAHGRATSSSDRPGKIAQETLAICESGSYTCPSEEGSATRDVCISAQLAFSFSGTVLLRPDDTLPTTPAASTGQFSTRITVRNEDTLSGVRRLSEHYSLLSDGSGNCKGPAVLNFASAKNPGGGFLGGATAQEESLARCSAMYKCQIKFRSEFYEQHSRRSNDEANRLCLYSSSIIYSPGVPVFRGFDHALLPQPFPASFVTCPAVNMSNAARVGVPWQRARQVMHERAARVLQVMHAHGHRHIVLGAWGCGVFQNPPEDIVRIFLGLLGPGGKFKGLFEEVAFSVLDNTKSRATFEAFQVLDNTK